MDKYPPGALRTIEEVQTLIQRVKAGETVKVYPVTFGNGTPAVPDLTPAQLTGLGGLRYLTFKYDGPTLGEFDLAWRGVVNCLSEQDCYGYLLNEQGCYGYLFENYWHAYAYSLRVNHDRKRDS
jgi:hypothetical protein